MVTRTTVQLTDDLTGEQADEQISFSLDGTNYVIDLTHDNAQEMRKLMDVYITAGRKLKRGEAPFRPRAYTQPIVVEEDETTWSKLDRVAMQQFAEINGLKRPAERGRIANGVVTAWIAAGRPGAE